MKFSYYVKTGFFAVNGIPPQEIVLVEYCRAPTTYVSTTYIYRKNGLKCWDHMKFFHYYTSLEAINYHGMVKIERVLIEATYLPGKVFYTGHYRYLHNGLKYYEYDENQ